MPIENTTTHTLAPDQVGNTSLVSTAWSTVGSTFQMGFGIGQETYPGMVFDLSSTLTSEPTTGRLLEPPRFIPPLTLTMQMSTNPDAGTLSVYVVPEVNPDDYSSGATTTPFRRGELTPPEGLTNLLGTANLVSSTDPQTVTITTDLGRLGAFMNDSSWLGRFALSMTYSGGPPAVRVLDSSVSLSLLSIPFHTGWHHTHGHNPLAQRGRGVRDQRFGMPALSTNLTKDRDRPGLWVRPEHSDDPSDPSDPDAG